MSEQNSEATVDEAEAQAPAPPEAAPVENDATVEGSEVEAAPAPPIASLEESEAEAEVSEPAVAPEADAKVEESMAAVEEPEVAAVEELEVAAVEELEVAAVEELEVTAVEEPEAEAEPPSDDSTEQSEASAEETAAESAPSPEITIDDLKPKLKLNGTVRRLELYGAFIDIGMDVTALIHISQLRGERVNRVSDILKLGDEITVWVEKVDMERKQVMVTMVEPLAVDWRDLRSGQVRNGTVTRLETFGAFINIGAEREGLVHISELSHEFVKHPSEVLSVGQEVDVKILGFSRRKRRIDLSVKALVDAPEAEQPAPRENGGRKRRRRQSEREEHMPTFDIDDAEDEDMPTAMEIAMRKAMGDDLPARSKSAARRRGRRQKMRAQQDDVLDRTLQIQRDS